MHCTDVQFNFSQHILSEKCVRMAQETRINGFDAHANSIPNSCFVFFFFEYVMTRFLCASLFLTDFLFILQMDSMVVGPKSETSNWIWSPRLFTNNSECKSSILRRIKMSIKLRQKRKHLQKEWMLDKRKIHLFKENRAKGTHSVTAKKELSWCIAVIASVAVTAAVATKIELKQCVKFGINENIYSNAWHSVHLWCDKMTKKNDYDRSAIYIFTWNKMKMRTYRESERKKRGTNEYFPHKFQQAPCNNKLPLCPI